MMRRLSNFFRQRNPAPQASNGVVCRPVQRQEIESALRLILADDKGLAGDEAVLDFLQFAVQRKIDVNLTWIAEAGGRIVWALLPITSPGRTMLLFTPNRVFDDTPEDAARQLAAHVCAHWHWQEDMQLAQFLLDPQDSDVRDLYVSCGFEVLAELIYLQRTVQNPPPPELPNGFELLTYSPETHDLFARTIQTSYEGSLDCPALNGKRTMEDVIAGHKATGVFDPSLWRILAESGQPRGVLILSPSAYNDAVELVYLGLVPEARHRGLSDTLMRLALDSVVAQRRRDLSLAVDSRNVPALRLYYRHGLSRIGSRTAMVKDLRT
jgi:ribosomal protein S18 acetylase RimI-like enzyme